MADEALSPTTIVLNYLRAKGIPPSSANVRAALEANARDPGVLPGLRSDTAATAADDKVAMGQSKTGSGTRQPQTRSTLPVDLGLGPTNEADWQPNTGKTTSAPPATQDVLSMQNATNPAMRAAVPEIPPPPSAAQPIPPPPVPQAPVAPEPGQWNPQASPWGAPRPPNAAEIGAQAEQRPTPPVPEPPPATPMEAQMQEAIQPRSPGLSIENVPMPPPQTTVQAPPASSIPPSGGLSIEDRMMPRPQTTIQAPPAASLSGGAAPAIEETTPILNRIVRGGAAGAGTGRMFGPYGAVVGGVAGAAPGLWDLGRHIVGR